MKKLSWKQIYPIILSIFIVGLLICYLSYSFKPDSSIDEFLVNSNEYASIETRDASVKKKTSKSSFAFFISSDNKKFFEDVDCKESYLIYNYFSELLDSYEQRYESLGTLTVKLGSAGLFNKALQIANIIEDNDDRNATLVKIIMEMLKVGDFDRALKLAYSLDEKNKLETLEDITSYLAEKGDLKKALEIAESIELSKKFKDYETQPRHAALRNIAKEFQKRGQTDQALKIADSIEYWESRVVTLNDLAENLMQTGKNEKGKEVFQKAYEVINTLEITDLPNYEERMESILVNDLVTQGKNRGFYTIAKTLAKSGEAGWAKQIFEKTYKMIRAMDKKEGTNHYFYSCGTVESIISSGFYEWGIELAYDYNNNWVTSGLFSRCAIELAEMNKFEFASQLFDKALELEEENNGIKSCDREKQRMIPEILESDGIDWALELANSISDKKTKEKAFSDISEYLAKVGQIEKSLGYVISFNDSQIIFSSLKKIALVLLEQENYLAFDTVFDQLLDIANSFEEGDDRNNHFFDISGILLEILCKNQKKYVQKFVTAYDML